MIALSRIVTSASGVTGLVSARSSHPSASSRLAEDLHEARVAIDHREAEPVRERWREASTGPLTRRSLGRHAVL